MNAYTISELKPHVDYIWLPFGNEQRNYVVSRLSMLCKYRELMLVFFSLMQALGTRTEVHGGINFIANDGLGMGGGALYVTSMAQLRLFQGANLTFEGNTGV